MHHLLLVIAFCVSTAAYSQVKKDSADYYSKKIKAVNARVSLNRTICIADTTLAFIKGKVVNHENRGVQSEIFIQAFQSKKQTSIETDEEGNFNFYTQPDSCLLVFENTAYGNVAIDTLSLTSGQIQEIKISLGSRLTVQHFIRIKPTAIYAEPPRKERHYKDEIPLF